MNIVPSMEWLPRYVHRWPPVYGLATASVFWGCVKKLNAGECKSAWARQFLAIHGEVVKESSQLMCLWKGEGLFNSWVTRGANSLDLLQKSGRRCSMAQSPSVCAVPSTGLGTAEPIYMLCNLRGINCSVRHTTLLGQLDPALSFVKEDRTCITHFYIAGKAETWKSSCLKPAAWGFITNLACE